MYRKQTWNNYQEEELNRLHSFAAEYTSFISRGKTERECVDLAVDLCKAKGWLDLDEVVASGRKLQPGDRVYRNWMGKAFLGFIIGSKPFSAGMNILGAHIDSPRVDVKQNPLYENESLAYLDTHYYGGIKKYQWVTIPLALHGVAAMKDGTVKKIVIGEDPADPVFCISDLLIHLSANQMKKTGSEVIEGENLDVIIGSQPLQGEEKDAVAKNALKLLKDYYGMEEEDFISAELEFVPAGAARDLGLDRSLIAGYGHDDRCCAYPSLRALLDYEGTPERALCCILTDKEEIGSVGATGMNSRYFENTVAEVYDAAEGYDAMGLRRLLCASRMLSSDVSAGFDPLFASAFEKKNAGILGQGVCFNKFTGRGGKGGSNDANAEFLAEIRRIMNDNNVGFQTCELGRVDEGGGGTIAYICANLCISVIDAGISVLCMHAPWEIISKADLWEEYKCYCAFLKDAGK